jgi:catechol 2,3-dioxygenase-like lactoylglutathione lyase family enzyme
MHIVLAVSDVDRAYDFYRGVFGWTSHLEWPGEYTELVVTDDDRLGLYRRDGWAETAGAEPVEVNGHVSPAYLYVRVDDLDETIERLGKAGPGRLAAGPKGAGATRPPTSPIPTATSSRSRAASTSNTPGAVDM